MLKDEWSEEIDQIKQTIGDLQQENECTSPLTLVLSNEVEILTRNNNEQQKLVQQQ